MTFQSRGVETPVFLKVRSRNPWGTRDLLKGLQVHTVYDHTKIPSAFITVVLSQVHSGVFQRLRDMGYHKIKTESRHKNPVSPIKPDKRFVKM